MLCGSTKKKKTPQVRVHVLVKNELPCTLLIMLCGSTARTKSQIRTLLITLCGCAEKVHLTRHNVQWI